MYLGAKTAASDASICDGVMRDNIPIRLRERVTLVDRKRSGENGNFQRCK